jgi:hypothetical protein
MKLVLKVTKVFDATFINHKQVTVKSFSTMAIIKAIGRAVLKYLVKKYSVNYLCECFCVSDEPLRFHNKINQRTYNGHNFYWFGSGFGDTKKK